MAWPTTDASTAALDSGTDDPNLARPQIKLNIENANAIKNEFGNVDITSPQNGQLLQYNSTSAKWVNATVSTGGTNGSTVILKCTAAGLSSGDTFTFTEQFDPDSVCTISSGNFVLASGDYYINVAGVKSTNANANNDYTLGLRNVTAGSNVFTVGNLVYAGNLSTVFTSNGSDVFGIRATGTVADLQDGWAVHLIKIS